MATRKWATWTVFASLLTCATGSAQTTGAISGRVTDSDGAYVPGVTVEATGANLQGARTCVTGPDGMYRLPALPPGSYRLTASLASFQTSEKVATVSLGAMATVDFTLQIAASEQVVVSGQAPPIDSTSTTGGTNYTSDVIARLPTDRNYADIVRMSPGVFVDRGNTQGRSQTLSIYGATSAENQWIIDGVNTTNVEKGTQGKAINNEFVQEVEVKAGGYQAEYGGALGGVINVITKSGGNDFHGSAFVYYDSGPLRAQTVYVDGVDSPASGMRLADYSRTDLGIDLGGYLVRDHLWFFAAYDRVEFPGHVATVDDSIPLVPSTMRFPLQGTDNLYSGKLTWNIAPSSTLIGTVFADPSENSGAGNADPRQGAANVGLIVNPDPGTWMSSRSVGATDYGARFQQLFGAGSLAAIQISRHQDRYWLQAASNAVRTEDKTCDVPSDGCNWPWFPNAVQGGFGWIYGPSDQNQSTRGLFAGSWDLSLGQHDIKFGAAYADSRSTTGASWTGGQMVTRLNDNDAGRVYYQHDFFTRSTENPSTVDIHGTVGSAELGAYIQDFWILGSQWTVNVGLRYDQQNLRDSRGNSVLRTNNEWQPRLGVVWSRDGLSKVYAFGGRFYYYLPTAVTMRPFTPWIWMTTYNFDPVGIAQADGVPNHPTSTSGGTGVVPAGYTGLAVDPVDAGLKATYQDEFTIGAEKLFGSSLWVSLKGTYRSLGNAIEDRCDLDNSRPENNYSSCAIINPGSNERFARGDFYSCTGLDNTTDDSGSTVYNNNCNGAGDPHSWLLHGAPPTPAAKRIYRAIELSARETFTDRFWMQFSYVYSSLRGNFDGATDESCATCWQEPGISAYFDAAPLVHNGYGRLFLDRPQDLRLAGFYVTPWMLAVGLETWARSGPPLDRTGYYCCGLSQPVQLVRRGYAGRLPTDWDANLTLSYPLVVGPAIVTIQAYIFNLFNNQIATGRDTTWASNQPDGYPGTIYDPNQKKTNDDYGMITSRTDPRLFRAAVKVSF